MSAHEVQAIMDQHVDPDKDHHRSGFRRTDPLSKDRLNSTSNSSAMLPHVEISSIREPNTQSEDDLDVEFSSFIQTPLGGGPGTRLSGVRTSEDDYTRLENVQNEYVRLHNVVHRYGQDHNKTDEWIRKIRPSYYSVDDEIKVFMSHMGLVGCPQFIRKGTELRGVLFKYKEELEKKAFLFYPILAAEHLATQQGSVPRVSLNLEP